jgi:hypothetical protein
MVWVPQPAERADGFPALSGRFRTRSCAALADLYQELMAQADGAIPLRRTLDPARVKRFLSNAVLFHIVEGDAIFRIVGQNVVNRFGYNPTGQSYTAFVEPERREAALAAFNACVAQPCAMYVDILQRFRSGGAAECEVLGVPFRDAPGDGPASHLFFFDQVLSDDRATADPEDGLVSAHIRARCFIDLGFGTPEGFTDLVQVDEEPPTSAQS